MKKSIDKGRKDFIKKTALFASLPVLNFGTFFDKEDSKPSNTKANRYGFPVVVSTWKHGMDANQAAWAALSQGKNALDAVEAGVRVSESDPKVTSVGYGGLPDASGQVTLDACIMDWFGECGAVSYLQHIKNPISVARKVMEDTPHVMLSGEGALQFALRKGFKKEDLLTIEARQKWEAWKKEGSGNRTSMDNHDTIGMLAIDEKGQIAGACTTSGLAWKMPGRVGDSPMIGAGLYIDGELAGAVATGRGEAVIKIAGSHLIVELIRQGRSPQEACEEAVARIIRKQKDHQNMQVGFLAISLKGEVGAYSLKKGFQYAVYAKDNNELIDAANAGF